MCHWLAILSALIALCTPAVQATADDPAPAGSATLATADDTPRSMFVLPSLDGPKQELAGFLGRVVLVHFFATWCEPCRAEMASLRQMQSKLGGQTFVIVPISVAEADGAVRRFFAGDSLPFTILLDRDRSVAKSWNVHTLPSSVVLDRNLKPRFMAEGDVDWARPDVMSTVADLLKEPPG
jgi:thiol-disulfide isomerase/thioredoxin